MREYSTEKNIPIPQLTVSTLLIEVELYVSSVWLVWKQEVNQPNQVKHFVV